MIFGSQRSEINHQTIKLFVGLIALFLANATSFFSEHTILSISESYHYGNWARDILVGSLVSIAALMAAYNGFNKWEMVITKIAALAALGVAFFPCQCGAHDEIIPKAHAVAALVMFLILAELCRIFYVRAMSTLLPNARRRAWLYVACGVVIIISILTLLLNFLLSGAILEKVPRLVFYCERAGLMAFGIAWLAASHVFPVITDHTERYSFK